MRHMRHTRYMRHMRHTRHARHTRHSRELFGISHLRASQAPTESLPYELPPTPFPTGIIAPCDACGGWIDIPDALARTRGCERVATPFTCTQSLRVTVSEDGRAEVRHS